MPNSLLTPELLRRLEQFQLLAARRAKSSSKGERRSRARGQSVEFADYRNYVHGDDFRYLDWNLYGRLERLFLKLYEEERELPVRIFLDASESMTFRDPRKFDFTRQIAAAVGYVALSGFDRVSVVPFPSQPPFSELNEKNVTPQAYNAEMAARGECQDGTKPWAMLHDQISEICPPAGWKGIKEESRKGQKINMGCILPIGTSDVQQCLFQTVEPRMRFRLRQIKIMNQPSR